MQDDPTILDGDPLWRRIAPRQFILDQNLDRWRPSSAAFSNSSDGSGMSVVLGRDAQEAGRSPTSILRSQLEFGVVSLQAGICRRLRQIVARDPQEYEPHHAVVEGHKPQSARTAFAESAMVLIPPRTESAAD